MPVGLTNDIEGLQDEIRSIISRSRVPEDPVHAQNTLEWLLKLRPDADEALHIAALGHDIERAMEDRKVCRDDYENFDTFKADHAKNSAQILKKIMEDKNIGKDLIEEVYRLVCRHETGGDTRSDLIRDADGLSFFEVNLPLYFEREGLEKTLERCRWGYQRLSPRLPLINRPPQFLSKDFRSFKQSSFNPNSIAGISAFLKCLAASLRAIRSTPNSSERPPGCGKESEETLPGISPLSILPCCDLGIFGL